MNNAREARRYSALRYTVFIAGNVLILFMALHGARMAFESGSSWWISLLVSVIVNAIVLPVHIRRYGPVWRWFAPTFRMPWHRRVP